MPDRAVVIAFDDGLSDQLPAATVCAAAGFPATVYVVSGFVDRPGCLNHYMLGELVNVPDIEVGAHSVSHLHLNRVSPDTLAREGHGQRHVAGRPPPATDPSVRLSLRQPSTA